MADTNQILRLAAIIREVDGNHSKGAAALAESILDHPDFRAALAADGPAVPDGREPASVTEQPSDEEIMGLMPQQMHEDLAYAARAMANEAGTDNRKAKGFMRIALNRHAVDLARAVLARWGNPAPQPVPVSERPPEDQLCWWFEPDEEDDEAYGSSWTLLRICGGTSSYTHCLPAHALPIPHQQEDHQ